MWVGNAAISLNLIVSVDQNQDASFPIVYPFDSDIYLLLCIDEEKVESGDTCLITCSVSYNLSQTIRHARQSTIL